jgi:hypothetical protein
MTVTAYNSFMNSANMPLQGNAPTVIVRLRLPTTGTFILFGKVNMENVATTPQALVANLTTDDGNMICAAFRCG